MATIRKSMAAQASWTAQKSAPRLRTRRADRSPSTPLPTLAQQLLKEAPAELARAARERGDAGRGAVLFFQPFLTCARCHDP